MALTFGFYNSLDGDRRYDTVQISQIFDGIINDGVFQSIGDFFATKPSSGLSVTVGTGRAWFNHTWTLNDALIPLTVDAADPTLTRIDAVVLEVDSSELVRANSIKIVKGTAASEPTKPAMTNTDTLHQHPLAYITVKPGMTEVKASEIEIMVGKSECPFVTAILETTDIDAVFARWESQFTAWFENVQSQLEGDIATNLQRQIDANASRIDGLAEIIENPELDKVYDTTSRKAVNILSVPEDIAIQSIDTNSLADDYSAFRFNATSDSVTTPGVCLDDKYIVIFGAIYRSGSDGRYAAIVINLKTSSANVVKAHDSTAGEVSSRTLDTECGGGYMISTVSDVAMAVQRTSKTGLFYDAQYNRMYKTAKQAEYMFATTSFLGYLNGTYSSSPKLIIIHRYKDASALPDTVYLNRDKYTTIMLLGVYDKYMFFIRQNSSDEADLCYVDLSTGTPSYGIETYSGIKFNEIDPVNCRNGCVITDVQVSSPKGYAIYFLNMKERRSNYTTLTSHVDSSYSYIHSGNYCGTIEDDLYFYAQDSNRFMLVNRNTGEISGWKYISARHSFSKMAYGKLVRYASEFQLSASDIAMGASGVFYHLQLDRPIFFGVTKMDTSANGDRSFVKRGVDHMLVPLGASFNPLNGQLGFSIENLTDSSGKRKFRVQIFRISEHRVAYVI